MNDILKMRFSPASAEIIYKDFGDELVVTNLDTGLFYGLGGSAGIIWAKFVAGHSGAEIASAFAGPDEDEVAGAISKFVAELIAENLIVSADSAPHAALSPTNQIFVAPTMERFDDLQGILLLDPIHDLGAAAWPTVAHPTPGTD